MIKVNEINMQSNRNLFFTKLQRRASIFTSTAMALALSACGRETRSTDEVELVDETSNIPTEFDDKLIGDDDIDAWTGLGGNDEIYGFGGNDTINAGSGDDTVFGGDGDDTILPGAGDDKVYGEGGNDTDDTEDESTLMGMGIAAFIPGYPPPHPDLIWCASPRR